jgi:seryl-tRNA synthetase
MLDLKRIRSETDRVREALRFKKSDADLNRLLERDERRREILVRSEALKRERNEVSEEIGRKRKSGEDASTAIVAMKGVGEEIKTLDGEVGEIEAEIERILAWIPNLPHESAPRAEDASGNVVVRNVGEPRRFDFTPKPHWELGEQLGILDMERAVKLTGARFAVYWDMGAKLERALANFMLDLHTGEHGYTEVLTPYMVNSASMYGTGQLPKFASDLFKIDDHDLWLIPTAEVPVTNIVRDEILPLEEANNELTIAVDNPFDVEVVASEPGMKRFRSRGFPFQVARSFVDAAHLHLRIMRFGCRAGSLPL